MKIQPVIMSGGAGTRLWPMSRKSHPKQFLELVTDKTMFQETALRVAPSADSNFLDPIVIAGATHGALVADQLSDIGLRANDVILEPCPRNTAAVAAVAAIHSERKNGDALILLMPADHHIADVQGFQQTVEKGAKAAAQGHIVTLGIAPKSPHTGYGYIHRGEEIADSVYTVEQFKEKPDAATANQYLNDGGYYWNAGIFLFSAQAMVDELKLHASDILTAATEALDKSVMVGAARRLDEKSFSACPSESIDYAVMEPTEKAAIVAPVDVGWTDIGSWSEIETKADNRIIEADCKNMIIRSTGPVIGAVGVEN